MKQLFYCILLMVITLVSITSCKDKSPVRQVIDSYKAGTITEDSLYNYLSDSANLQSVKEWAEKKYSRDDYAAFILGRAYQRGLGVKTDPTKAKAYYLLAAEKNNVLAMTGVSYLYSNVIEPENLDSAFYWSTKASEMGYGRGYYQLGKLEEQRKTTANLPVDSAVMIRHWMKGVNLNDPYCRNGVAWAYYMGWGIEQDNAKAFNTLSYVDKTALPSGGLYLLGMMYELGDGTQQNYKKAIECYRLAADKGDADGYCKLGVFYFQGTGVERDYSLAFENFKKAADSGSAWGQRVVGVLYDGGLGVEQDEGAANTWLAIAARNGDSEAIRICKIKNIEY